MKTRDPGVAQPAGFYGKIPAAGDFIHRRLSQNTIFAWDSWLRHSLYESRTSHLAGRVNDTPSRNVIWNFIVPATICGESLIGMITPSCDRVGRQFPFTMFKSLTNHSGGFLNQAEIGDFFATHQVILGSIGQRKLNINQLEATLADACTDGRPVPVHCQPTPSSMPIPSAIFDVFEAVNDRDPSPLSLHYGLSIPWTDLVIAHVAVGSTSYWWSNAAGSGPMKAFTHSGGLNQTLFNTLFFNATR